MSSEAGFRFDVFLSHASEDKDEVRVLAQRLEASGITVWLDEEQLPPGFDPQTAIVRGLEESRHVLIWITDAWLDKPWTRFELKLFAESEKSTDRRVVPVLLVPWDNRVLGPYLTDQIAVPPALDDDERTWLAICGVRGTSPGKRDTWAERGRGPTADEEQFATGVQHAPPAGTVAARLEAAYSRREETTIAGEDTTKVDAEIRGLRRQQREGPSLHRDEFLGNGRFRLILMIGRGGFATVWKAYDRQERQLVAVKVLHGQFAQDSSRRERLFRGARKMAEIQHPDVVRVLVPEAEEQGFHYFVMEYVAGGDLQQAIAGKRLDVDRALAVVESIAGALEATHQRGLVHRDVKPHNILLRGNGAPALSDFDLVLAADTSGGTLSGALGTVLYSAPEQSDDASTVDHRADIYSLGMTAVFCVHGKKLPKAAMFQRNAFLAGLRCEDRLRAVLAKAVALEPKDRFETMMAFRTALRTARQRASLHESAGADATVLGDDTADVVPQLPPNPSDAAASWPRLPGEDVGGSPLYQIRDLKPLSTPDPRGVEHSDAGTSSPQHPSTDEFPEDRPSLTRRKALLGGAAVLGIAGLAWAGHNEDNGHSEESDNRGGTTTDASGDKAQTLSSPADHVIPTVVRSQTLYVVRHAEKVAGIKDPGLTRAGKERASRLAMMLQDVEFDAIYATEYQRTRETVAPVAEQKGLQVAIVPAADIGAIAETLTPELRNILVCGHTNTIPMVLHNLGVGNPPDLESDDYDRIFVLTLRPDARAELTTLRY